MPRAKAAAAKKVTKKAAKKVAPKKVAKKAPAKKAAKKTAAKKGKKWARLNHNSPCVNEHIFNKHSNWIPHCSLLSHCLFAH